MRIVIVLLLLANLTLFAYTRLDSAAAARRCACSEQVQPDKIKLLTPQQVAALGPAEGRGARRRLRRMGPVLRRRAREGARRPRAARARPAAHADARSTSTARSGSTSARSPARRAADRRVGELRAQGVTRHRRRSTPAAASTSCRSASSAPRRRRARTPTSCARQGVPAAKVEPRAADVSRRRCSSSAIRASRCSRGCKDLQPQYLGSDLKIGACRGARADPPRERRRPTSRRRVRCSRNTRRRSTSTSASRASPRSSRRCRARTRRRAAGCCSPVRRARRRLRRVASAARRRRGCRDCRSARSSGSTCSPAARGTGARRARSRARSSPRRAPSATAKLRLDTLGVDDARRARSTRRSGFANAPRTITIRWAVRVYMALAL